ncbi:hypothetical protein [Hymenobacter terrenus]|uniref:hypothetical protein n=1 Tax=Hymenobacter terrenus TaxID=1629124 RepID=UPI000619EDA0|nr:hypothetical protein [Hymenobacter terrenus]
MKKQLTILASALLLTTGCEQAKQAKESYSALSKLSEAGKEMTTNLEKAKTDRAEREKRGDTLSLPYKELQQFLPTAVSGYTAGELSGQSQKMSGMAFSSAERAFTNGEEEVKVALIDYNGSNALYEGAAAMMALGIEQEDDDHIMGPTTLKVDGVKGMETYYKKDGRAEMTLAVGGRFLLTLTGSKQKDMARLKSIAEEMDLEKLAKM